MNHDGVGLDVDTVDEVAKHVLPERVAEPDLLVVARDVLRVPLERRAPGLVTVVPANDASGSGCHFFLSRAAEAAYGQLDPSKYGTGSPWKMLTEVKSKALDDIPGPEQYPVVFGLLRTTGEFGV